MPLVPTRVLRRHRVTVINDEEAVVRACHERLLTKVPGVGHLRYCVWQLERTPTTDKLHIQLYVEWTKGVKYTHVHQFLGVEDSTVLSCDANRQANIDYVTKEATRDEGPFSRGEGPAQGARTDIEECKQLLDEGATDAELFDSYFHETCRYYRAFSAYRLAKGVDDAGFKRLDVRVYWGATGTGKSRRARYEAERAN